MALMVIGDILEEDKVKVYGSCYLANDECTTDIKVINMCGGEKCSEKMVRCMSVPGVITVMDSDDFSKIDGEEVGSMNHLDIVDGIGDEDFEPHLFLGKFVSMSITATYTNIDGESESQTFTQEQVNEMNESVGYCNEVNSRQIKDDGVADFCVNIVVEF